MLHSNTIIIKDKIANTAEVSSLHEDWTGAFTIAPVKLLGSTWYHLRSDMVPANIWPEGYESMLQSMESAIEFACQLIDSWRASI